MEVTEISKEKFNGVYILGIDAKDIYLSNHYLNTPDKTGYRIRGTNGTISTRKFVNTLDYSLDLIKLREIYEKFIAESILVGMSAIKSIRSMLSTSRLNIP